MAPLQQADEHPALLVLATEEHRKNPDQPFVLVDREPEGRLAKGKLPQPRQQIIMALPAKGGRGDPKRVVEDVLQALRCPPGFLGRAVTE